MTSIDFEGFLLEPTLWDENVALELARYEDIPFLTKEHWKIIFFIRDYYQDFKKIPSTQKICTHFRCRTLDIYKYFPGGPLKSACRIAGIPKIAQENQKLRRG